MGYNAPSGEPAFGWETLVKDGLFKMRNYSIINDLRCLSAVIGMAVAAFCTPGEAASPATSTVAGAAQKASPLGAYSLCREMASPAFAGRLTGDAGYTAAARWAAETFKKWGLRPASEKGGFLQAYPSPYTLVDRAEMALFLPDAREPSGFREVKAEPVKDFLPLLFSDSGDRTGELVFAGWGISAPELGYDDYAGVDVSGRFALCFRGTPDPEDVRYTDHDQHRTRMRAALKKGAAGLVYIYDKPQANPNGDFLSGFLPAEISQSMADKVLETKGLTSEQLRKDLARYRRPLSFQLQAKIRLAVASRHFPDGEGYNVAAVVPGIDADLKNECVVVGAHFDACGPHMGMEFAGANDNASGSASVMEAGRIMASLETRPRRDVVFALFGGEEKGLEGSQFFADHLPPPYTRVVGMVNLDMTGEGAGVWCGYSKAHETLSALVGRVDAALGSKVVGKRAFERVGVRSSDFAPFFTKGVPCVNFSSDGPHVFYHEPGDTIYRINPDILADAARYAFLTAWLMACE